MKSTMSARKRDIMLREMGSEYGSAYLGGRGSATTFCILHLGGWTGRLIRTSGAGGDNAKVRIKKGTRGNETLKNAEGSVEKSYVVCRRKRESKRPSQPGKGPSNRFAIIILRANCEHLAGVAGIPKGLTAGREPSSPVKEVGSNLSDGCQNGIIGREGDSSEAKPIMESFVQGTPVKFDTAG